MVPSCKDTRFVSAVSFVSHVWHQEPQTSDAFENLIVYRKVLCYNVTESSSHREQSYHKGGSSMDKYKCVCTYEYDPAVGDPDNGIAPGTPFEELPDDWKCPFCGAGKEVFEKV